MSSLLETVSEALVQVTVANLGMEKVHALEIKSIQVGRGHTDLWLERVVVRDLQREVDLGHDEELRSVLSCCFIVK